MCRKAEKKNGDEDAKKEGKKEEKSKGPSNPASPHKQLAGKAPGQDGQIAHSFVDQKGPNPANGGSSGPNGGMG